MGDGSRCLGGCHTGKAAPLHQFGTDPAVLDGQGAHWRQEELAGWSQNGHGILLPLNANPNMQCKYVAYRCIRYVIPTSTPPSCLL